MVSVFCIHKITRNPLWNYIQYILDVLMYIWVLRFHCSWVYVRFSVDKNRKSEYTAAKRRLRCTHSAVHSSKCRLNQPETSKILMRWSHIKQKKFTYTKSLELICPYLVSTTCQYLINFSITGWYILTSNENATRKWTSLSRGCIEYTFTEDFLWSYEYKRQTPYELY